MVYRVCDPPDTEIAWCIQLYQSRPRRCLQYLRESYPCSRIVLLVDGDVAGMADYAELGHEFGAEVVRGEHLMKFATCHLYVERLLRQALTGPERYFFRIDPDTRIWRRFAWLPDLACAFGTLETVTDAFRDRIGHPPNIQGGCIGLTREASAGVLASGVLSAERCVTQAHAGWARSKDCAHLVAHGAMLDDFLISWAVDSASFPILQHPEIASHWRGAADNTARRFAVTHPHKDMESP